MNKSLFIDARILLDTIVEIIHISNTRYIVHYFYFREDTENG